MAPSAPAQGPDTTATVQVLVPANADVWFDGNKSTDFGPMRTVSTPSLQPGKTASFEVKVSWTENGQPVTRTQRVDVQAGNQRVMNFMLGVETKK
jgi:uncharacterized protein (TIGR03000 family)